jgi:biotin/methionine sulfoxide reductase
MTPSGKFEIFSQDIADQNLSSCYGHPYWFEKQEYLGAPAAKQYPLHLISNQPKTRLHSQLDHGVTSRESKVKDREVMRIHPQTAAAKGIKDGDVVRVFNERGSCLVAARCYDGLHPNVIEIPTGAWYEPVDPSADKSLDAHGNPNVLTQDVGSSDFAQGCSAHSCLVDVEPFTGELPPITVFSQPATCEA